MNWVQLLVNLGIFIYVVRRSRLNIEDTLLYTAFVVMMGFILSASFLSILNAFGMELTSAEALPLSLLLVQGIGLIITINKKQLPRHDKGAVIMWALSYFYLAATMTGWIRWPLLVFGFIFLGFSVFERKKIWMGSLLSLSRGFICLYQVAFFENLIEVSRSEVTPQLVVESFFIQLSVFWAFFYLGHFWQLLTGDSKAKADLENLISVRAMAPRRILLVLALHGTPLILNLLFNIIPVSIMLTYSIVISPVFVEKLLSKAQNKQPASPAG